MKKQEDRIKNKLAAYGGKPLRKAPFPSRRLFDEEALQSVIQVFKTSWQCGIDFGFQGEFEERYTKAFCEYMGGGYADAVSSGTAAFFISLASLGLPVRSKVLFSPVTDPGGVTPALLLGMIPVIADSKPGSFNIGHEQFYAALTPDIKAAVITHIGGIPVDIDPIFDIAASKGIKIIEDCSQAHGALYKGKQVGRFGDIAFFSTMFSKNHASGGCGGIVYTKKKELYRQARSWADRGKPFYEENFNPKNPTINLFPSLNFNQDELSCAIGLSTLRKLDYTIYRRNEIIQKICHGLKGSKAVAPVPLPNNIVPSPFFLTLKVDTARLKVSKKEFVMAIAAEGIDINPNYCYVVSEWNWIKPYLKGNVFTPNAKQFRKESFNVLFNERYHNTDVEDLIACILKVDLALAY